MQAFDPYHVYAPRCYSHGLVACYGRMHSLSFAGKTLIRCLYTTTDRARLQGYPSIGEAAFGKFGLMTVHLFHKMSLLGLCILLLILEGRLLAESFQDWIGDVQRPQYLFDWTRHWIWVIKKDCMVSEGCVHTKTKELGSVYKTRSKSGLSYCEPNE